MAFVDHTTGGRIILEGIMPIKITLDDTCEVGDLIGYDAITDDAWEKADANGKIPAQLIAGEKCETSGDEITCFKMALIDFTSDCSATPGDVVYLADTAGQYAASASWVPQDLGQMVSARVAFINPSAQMPFGYTTTGVHGAFIRAELMSGKTAPAGVQYWGLRIDVKTIPTSTITTDIFGLWIFGQIQSVGSAERHMVRLEDGCANNMGFKSFIQFVGGALADPPDFLFSFSTLVPTNNAWKCNASGNPTNSGGQIKLDFGGTTRYIKLWKTSG